MNNFGGHWTEIKIEILVEYAKAYLTIMNNHPYWKLIYFDGFAGSGIIEKNEGEEKEIIYGASKRIIEIDKPKPFNMYYFVEKNDKTFAQLIDNTKEMYPDKEMHLVREDCNNKLKDMADFLNKKENKKYKVLAYIDPFGMQLEWSSLEYLKNSPIDLWVLVPSGIGVNRLLKRNGQISDSWLKKLERFLGMNKEEIEKYFYYQESTLTLFGREDKLIKEHNAIETAGKLYKEKMLEIFNFVSRPYLLKNSQNTIMFHLYMASNNKYAVNIANDIINKYDKIHN